ncbi:hypothetical protein F5Y12DRAFT_446639 [Xylaria sp. FL1777]|nr:hypothetical protein F5Y12DRAFT_446639 [Xylaria sp. FL1777]
MTSESAIDFMGSTIGAQLIGVQQNLYRPARMEVICKETGQFSTERVGISKPTKCLFRTEHDSLKWVAVNAGVFPGSWSFKDSSHLVFPPFPMGPWNVGQIRRLENGEVRFTKTLEMPLEGIRNAWHPTEIDFSDFVLISQLNGGTDGRLWEAQHPHFNEETVFVKIAPWDCDWSKQAMENETRVYQIVDGLGIAPEFLGHVTYHGAIIGFILEWVGGGETIEKKDRSARIDVAKRLHSLGVTHGSAHRSNFLKKRKDVLMIDFEDARFDHEATYERKNEDIRRICDFEGDRWTIGPIVDEDNLPPNVDKFFDDMVDDEIDWTDDSDAADSDSDDD